MTLKEFRDVVKDFPDDFANNLVLSIGIRDEKDIVEENGHIIFPEFSERYDITGVNIISEGTMAPKLFFIGNRKK
jgi:hypothetical protein